MVLNRVLLLLLISNINRVRPDLGTAANLGSAITHLGRVRHDLPFPIIGREASPDCGSRRPGHIWNAGSR